MTQARRTHVPQATRRRSHHGTTALCSDWSARAHWAFCDETGCTTQSMRTHLEIRTPLPRRARSSSHSHLNGALLGPLPVRKRAGGQDREGEGGSEGGNKLKKSERKERDGRGREGRYQYNERGGGEATTRVSKSER